MHLIYSYGMGRPSGMVFHVFHRIFHGFGPSPYSLDFFLHHLWDICISARSHGSVALQQDTAFLLQLSQLKFPLRNGVVTEF